MISKRNEFRITILLVFLIVSFLFISPPVKKERSSFRSSELKKVTIKDGNTERTDYCDANGKAVVAGDLGYATIIVTKTDNSKLEQYYDDKGDPVSRYNGYYAVLREYDENGNNIRISYLDLNCEPMIIANGYAIEEREYNESGQFVAAKYCDTVGDPIYTRLYGYGKLNEYDENGNNYLITYIDASGAPMMTGQGYAIVKRNFYISEGPYKGKVESEFYFDETGSPVKLLLGQSGIHKEYDENGREKTLTYLDENGDPIITTKGYTTVVRTYQPNNSVATEMYFDSKGDPVALSEGQYGTDKENGQTVYLDQNGERLFNLKNLLYNRSWLVILFALIIVFLSAFSGKKANLVFMIVYVIGIAYITLMFRDRGEGKLKLELFWSYKSILTNSEERAGILKNIWLFIPLGAILYRIDPKRKILLIPIVLSIMIEAVQYFAGTGFCEFDDVISNGLGGLIGFEASGLICDLKSALSSGKKQLVL